MAKIKIGQIGTGHNHAAAKMNALRQLGDIYDVVGIVENDPKWMIQRGNDPAYAGLQWLTEEELFNIPDLQAVAVETDSFELVPTALRCAERKLHVHMDKPGGESLAEFRRLLEHCEASSLAFQQAYVYRYNPAVRFCLEAARNGWLGNIFEVHAVMSRYDGDNAAYRRWLAQFRGGAMYIFAGYLIDLVVSMLGRPDVIAPFMKQTRDDGLVDNGLAVLEYERATATIRVSVEEVDGMKHRRLIICGTNGTVELCPIEAPANQYDTQRLIVRLTLKNGNDRYSAGTHKVDCGVLGDRYAAQMVEFARIIRREITNPYPFQHEYLTHQVLLAACGYIKLEQGE